MDLSLVQNSLLPLPKCFITTQDLAFLTQLQGLISRLSLSLRKSPAQRKNTHEIEEPIFPLAYEDHFSLLTSGMKELLFFLLTTLLAHSLPPNLILIFTDDQGYEDLGCFGSTRIKTPHLDQMAAEGLKLTTFQRYVVRHLTGTPQPDSIHFPLANPVTPHSFLTQFLPATLNSNGQAQSLSPQNSGDFVTPLAATGYLESPPGNQPVTTARFF